LDELDSAVLFAWELIQDDCVVNECDEDLIVGSGREFEGGVVTESEVATEPDEGRVGHLDFYTHLIWNCCLWVNPGCTSLTPGHQLIDLTRVFFSQLVGGFPRFFDVSDKEAVAAVTRYVLLAENVAGVKSSDGRFGVFAGEIDPPFFGDFEILFDEVFCAGGTDGEDDPRLYEGELGNKPGSAGFGFLWSWGTILGFACAPIGGAAFDGVADIDFGSVEAVIGKGLVEHLSAASDKGSTSFVFLVTGAFADEDEGTIGVAFAEYDVGSSFVEGAFGASGCGLFELLELGHFPGFSLAENLG